MKQAAITLRAGAAECEIWPAKGGSIARWTIDGQDMFRAADADAVNDALPLGMASFPLVPYSNRIGHGRFEWNGKPIQLEPNFPPEPHAIHGTGWKAKWETNSQNSDSVVLHNDHRADSHWPWHFDAEQRIRLTEFSLTIDLLARNLSDQMAPLAFGHHPYFDSEGATLSFGADTVWRTGNDGLPAFAEAPRDMFDFNNNQPVQGRMLDNGYAGWNGNANIRWDDRPLQLNIIADMQAAVVYVPKNERYFCFEPVPHIIDSLNLTGQNPAMSLVAPGASLSAQILFKAIAAI
jgi:aldose 1-epimerase